MCISKLAHLIEIIRHTSECALFAASGMPDVAEEYNLPTDLVEFYQRAGGSALFPHQDYSWTIVPPAQVQRVNPILVGELCQEDISASWYIIAHNGNGDYLTIDLCPERLGLCYDSFHETHGLRGQTPIIARSFTELLERLYQNEGNYPYWLSEGFESLGDAYDSVPA